MEKQCKIQTDFLKNGIRSYPIESFSLELAKKYHLDVEDLFTYSFYQDRQVAFRAAWLLEHITLKEPKWLSLIYSELVERLPEQKNWSCLRSFTKILMLSTGKKSPIENNPQQEEIIIEQVFSWLIDDKCPVAVIVNCLDILNQLSDKNPWIKDELVAQIHYLLKTPTPALASRAKRILKRIANTK